MFLRWEKLISGSSSNTFELCWVAIRSTGICFGWTRTSAKRFRCCRATSFQAIDRPYWYAKNRMEVWLNDGFHPSYPAALSPEFIRGLIINPAQKEACEYMPVTITSESDYIIAGLIIADYCNSWYIADPSGIHHRLPYSTRNLFILYSSAPCLSGNGSTQETHWHYIRIP